MTRIDLMLLLAERANDTQNTLEHSFGGTAYSATSLKNQAAFLEALAYLVDHTTEQAWKYSQTHELDEALAAVAKSPQLLGVSDGPLSTARTGR